MVIPRYTFEIGNMSYTCRNFREYIRKNFFTNHDGTPSEYTVKNYWPYLPTPRDYITLLSRLVEICDLFGIIELDSVKGELQRKMHVLAEEREETRNWKPLEALIKDIEKPFTECSSELHQLYNRLQDKEIRRLDEALHDYLEGVYYSSVAMAVSTIEYRLLILMKKANSTETNKLDELTFGGLIKEYFDHEKDKYLHLLPSVHKPLLQLCNTYRIFSVHPKEEEINRKVATSVLNLTFEFLLDEKTIVSKE